MTKHDLKELAAMGAELGAAKAEVERLREALRPFAVFEAVRSKQGGCTPKSGTVWAVSSAGEETEITVEHLQASVSALSQQAEPQQSREAEGLLPEWWMEQHTEPSDTFTAVDMATAAAQGFRDGQEAVEQAPAQDEREAFEAWAKLNHFGTQKPFANSNNYESGYTNFCWKAWQARAARPTQTEPQPVAWMYKYRDGAEIQTSKDRWTSKDWPSRWDETPLYAAPIAQTAPHDTPVEGWPAYHKRKMTTMLDLMRGLRDRYKARVCEFAPQPEQSGLVTALEYYANGDHLLLADPDEWDTCSGEPANFLHDEAGTASVEDGSIAKVALEAYRAALSAQGGEQ